MEEWKEYKIADVCHIKHGFAFKGQYFTPSKQIYVCITPGNFAIKGGFKLDKPKYYNGPIPEDYILHADDLVVTMTDLSKEGDTLGYSALIPQNPSYIFLHNQRIGLVEKINKSIDKHFLYWIMRTYDYHKYIVNHCSGSTVKHTSPHSIGSYVFRAPSLDKQKDIASFLDNIEIKIELNRRINANLEEQAQAFFKSWFVDIDKKLCQKKKLKDFFNVITGKKDANFSTPNGKYPFFTCSQEVLRAPSYSFDGHAILIAGNGDFNVKRYIGKFEAYQRTYVLIPFESKYHTYLYLLIKYYLKEITGGYRGSVVRFITKGNIANFEFLFPIETFDNKLAILDSLYQKIDNNIHELNNLSALRDTLLPKLMSGEIKVE